MRLWDNASALSRLSKWLYFCVALILIGAAAVWVVNSPYFPIRQVRIVQPLKRVTSESVRVIVQQYLHGSIFKANVSAAQSELAKLPWVRRAEITRLWPDSIEILIQEREPVARVNQLQLIDEAGYLFQAPTQEKLPEITTDIDDMSSEIGLSIVELLKEFQKALQPIGLSIKQAEYSERTAWILVLNNDITVRLGRDDVLKRLNNFVWAWSKLLREKAQQIDYVDMRYQDGFSLRLHEAVQVSSTGKAGIKN